MLLHVKNLSTHYTTEEGIIRAVDDVSFQLNEGRTLGIVGESGCGKTALALSIMRLVSGQQAGGEILFEGRNLLALTEKEMQNVRGRDIGMIFQEPMTALNPVFSIGFQIGEALQIHRPDMTRGNRRARVMELLRLVGIGDAALCYKSYPHELSGGMRQRAVIAIALACEPRLVIADEPTTALDVTIQAQILDLLRHLKEELGMALILVSHDLGVISEMADDVLVMYAGRQVELAPTDDIFNNPMHPYTKALLGCLPKFNAVEKLHRMNTIYGSVPQLTSLPAGCSFRERCQRAIESCSIAVPEWLEKVPGHWVRCLEV